MKLKFTGLCIAAVLMWVTASDASAGYYNRSAAASYARKFALKYNLNFPYFEQDCANFVSQAIAVGQEQFVSHRDPAWSWFYNSRSSYSSSWIRTHLLFNFLNNHRRGYVVGQGVNSNRGAYNNLWIGDLVFCDWYINGDPKRIGEDGWIDHVYIVTGADSRGILVSAHTTDRLNMPFKDVFQFTLGQRGRFYYFRMYDRY